MKAVELLKKWTPEIEKEVREILNNDPVADFNWRFFAPMAYRRD